MEGSFDDDLKKLDYYTQLTLDNLWNELVQLSILNSTSTSKTSFQDDWEIINSTSFTEPLWGTVVNK
jgi:hypothetical protein